MSFLLRPVACALVVVCSALVVANTGCALRATTDFGPQSSNTTRSVTAGPEGLPGGISGTSGPGGDEVGLRGGTGNTFDGAGVSSSTNNGVTGTR